MKRLAFYAAVIAATLALLIILWQFRGIAILLILSLVLTAALRPSVDFLEARGLRAPLARALVYLLVFGVLGLGLYLISSPLAAELRVLSNRLVFLYDSTYRGWSDGTAFQQAVSGRLPAPDQIDEMMTGPAGAAVLRFLFGVTQNTAAILAGLIIVIALSLYWSADRSHFERLWLSLLPAGRRIQARRIWQTTENTMGDYLRSESIQAILAVLLLTAGYWLIGMDFPILMGLLAGVAWLVPLVGFIFAALVSFLFGLAAAGGLLPAVGALALTAGVLAFLEFVVEPRLFRRNQFSGMLIILIMVMMVDAYGLVGFLIAPPLAVAVQVLTGHIIRAVRRPALPTVEFESLEQRLAAVSVLFDAAGSNGEQPVVSPDLINLHKRLNGLLLEARNTALEERA